MSETEETAPEIVSPYSEEDADPYADDDTKNPWEETYADEEEPEDGEAPAPKRPRGRPRKAT